MQHRFPAWSFSSLTSFETCPKRYYHTKVAKDVGDPPGEAALWGQTVHAHLEERVRDNKPLPDASKHLEPLVARIASAAGTKLVEQQFAVTDDFRPTGWFAKDAWCRGIVDVGVLTGNKAALLDWKTGKRKAESDQLKLFAGLAFAHFPNLEVVQTAFVWLKANAVDKETFTRKEVPVIWGTFIPRVARMQKAFEDGRFPPRPSGLCNKWCPVPKSKCEFSGKHG